ncbi:secretion protein [Chryseobacterium soli]|uniref:Secretion protein n=1 Tax=Chryseobacterium soli TaxID=445961 RepID=A0A086A4D2_9FLAO|nr:T9SS type A sorting domain-containing protein [Chryseobacterium soli]KFF11546.1 secretion protein [Chryseobacterium soli]
MKRTTFFTICSLLISFFTFAQTSTEVFETESSGSTSFTDNGVIFNIISHNAPASLFDIGNFANTGWNGTANDNRYIDNTGTATLANANVSFSIKTTSNLFKVNRFWVFLANYLINQNAAGTLTITGKLSGITKFTQTKSNGFATSLGTTNGYTLIDLTNLNGQNYSNIVIDQLQLTIGGDYRYLGVDAFTWVKDTGVVLATGETKASPKTMSVYPNPTKGAFTIKTDENSKAEIYDQTGRLVKTLEVKKGVNESNIAELPKGVYILKTLSESHKIIKD